MTIWIWRRNGFIGCCGVDQSLSVLPKRILEEHSERENAIGKQPDSSLSSTLTPVIVHLRLLYHVAEGEFVVSRTDSGDDVIEFW
jgi:hypothetical protein